MTDTPKKGWELLHSQLPDKALKPISKDVYGVDGLTDVNEGYLITRLFASELGWSWEIVSSQYLGSEVRRTRGQNPYDYTVYLASVHGVLTVGSQRFHGSGAHDNRKIDAAFKGAATVAFKNAAKMAGLFAQLLLDGRAMDFIYATRDGEVVADTTTKPPSANTGNAGSPSTEPPTPPQTSTTPAPGPAAPGLQLNERQKNALGWLLKWGAKDGVTTAGELPADMNAKVRAFAKAQAHLVANPDDQPGAFEAAARELMDMHAIVCGPDCAHAKIVGGNLAGLSGRLEQQTAA